MLVASVSTDRLSCCQPDLMNLLQRERQMADPSRWLTHYMSYWHSYIGQPTHQLRKIQRFFGGNLQTSTRTYSPESTPIAEPTAPLYVDSSTRGKIHLRWQSSPPRLIQLNVPYHVESYVNAHSSRSAFFTVRLTSIGRVPGKQEFCLAPSETIVEQVKNKKSHLGHRLRMRTLGDMLGHSFVYFT